MLRFRRSHRSSLALLGLLALATSGLPAQGLVLRGKVENLRNTTGRFVLDCSRVELRSATLRLATWLGLEVEIRGASVGTAAAPVVRVDKIRTIARVLEIGGKAQIGTRLALQFAERGGTTGVLLWSLAPDFVAAGALGSLMLRAPGFYTVATVPTAGLWQQSVPLPNDPKLVGVTVYGQAFVLARAGSSAYLSNPGCKTIRA